VAARDLTGVLLVGGAGRRFGSPKALARLDGRTLAERAWRTLGETAVERIAVGKSADGLDLPFPLVEDGTEVRAALAGIVAGLRAARSDLAVFLPVDMPLVAADHLHALADACTGDAAAPQTGPLPCALRRGALPVLERRLAAGALTLRDALAELDSRVVPLDEDALVNVNTPADLAGLELRILPFHPEHAAGFRALVSETLGEFGFTADPALDPDLADPTEVYEAVWVAVRDALVVGSVALRRLGAAEVELKRMYLRPSERGNGVGRRLLDMALLWAREHGVGSIRLDTTERMEAARRLYEAYGFIRVPGDAPRQGQQRLLYELRLGA
jgi:molybdopterin-guanine dinucleotide biosynthesis protein A/N-acetylglutamate synthase-like GNAT family acetyltransferase